MTWSDNAILTWDGLREEWNWAANMTAARSFHAVSAVTFDTQMESLCDLTE